MDGSKLNKYQTKYYNTACLMDEALISLLEKKNYEFISIKEICDKAGVNRSTFYLHYENIDDLLSETIEYVGKKISLKFRDKAVLAREDILNCPIENLILVTPQYLIPYLEFVRENKKVFYAVFAQPKVLKTQTIYQYLYDEIFKFILERFNIPEDEHKYKILFYIYGMWGIIEKWIVNDCKEDTQYISRMIVECIGIE